MTFAQTKYKDKVGNGPFTLAQIGCFVTSFSNLMEKFGITEAPDTLNSWFTKHNAYMTDPADGVGVKDDLGWSSITAFDHSVNVTAIGSSGWPHSDTSIVEFHYTHNGRNVTHFCCVHSAADHTIIDSYDGAVKYAGIYGEPVAWAVYERHQPKAVTVTNPAERTVAQLAHDIAKPAAPVYRPAPAGARPFPSTAPYMLHKTVRGYVTAMNASQHMHSNSTVPAGSYTVFNRASGMINITNHTGHPGWWINPADNVVGGHGAGLAGSQFIGPREHSDPTVAPTPPVEAHMSSVATVRPYSYRTSHPFLYNHRPPLPPKPLRKSFMDRLAELFGTFDGYKDYKRKQGVRR